MSGTFSSGTAPGKVKAGLAVWPVCRSPARLTSRQSPPPSLSLATRSFCTAVSYRTIWISVLFVSSLKPWSVGVAENGEGLAVVCLHDPARVPPRYPGDVGGATRITGDRQGVGMVRGDDHQSVLPHPRHLTPFTSQVNDTTHQYHSRALNQ